MDIQQEFDKFMYNQMVGWVMTHQHLLRNFELYEKEKEEYKNEQIRIFIEKYLN